MSQKYTDARYPEKINNLIDNEGGLSEEGKSTINESVKEAMEGGDIPLPPAGTKLYLHSIKGKSSASSTSALWHLVVVDNCAEPYNIDNFNANAGGSFTIKARFFAPPAGITVLARYLASAPNCLHYSCLTASYSGGQGISTVIVQYDNGYVLQSKNLYDSLGAVEDTVTEL